MTEGEFKSKLKLELHQRFPGAIITQLDPTYLQGIPDILILYEDNWATLECKRSAKAVKRPNQEYWVDKLNKMSFSAFIYPENKEAVLDELERSFKRCS